MHELMLEGIPLVVLYCPADVVAIKRDLDGFRPWGVGHERLWNVRRVDTPAANTAPAKQAAFSGFRKDPVSGSTPDSSARSASGRQSK